ncbi:MAG: hypothetical protein KQJ78_20155 [Deltaproteobacteria bacterium]|nr:hypothetical protein [Deltaproteobacteria bacterium]
MPKTAPEMPPDTHKRLLKASLAAAGPTLVALVVLMSVNDINQLEYLRLGDLGVLAAGVLLGGLAFLLWRGRWWAAFPALSIYVTGGWFFLEKFIRPMNLYFSVNPYRGVDDLIPPLMMLSPALVIMVLCLALAVAVYQGLRLAQKLAPRPVSLAVWGMLALWLLVLGGDFYYQNAGWRHFPRASDLVVRLCSPDPAVKVLAEDEILKMGGEAVPALLLGLSTKDVDLGCLRQGSRQMLAELGDEGRRAMEQEAQAGNEQAVAALRELNQEKKTVMN